MNRDASIIKLRQLFANRKLTEARNLCLDLARKYPNDREIWTARADLHFQLGECDSFGECVEHILSHAASPTPTLINTYHLLGVMCAKARRVEDAIKVFEHSIAADPRHAAAHTCKAMAHLLLGEVPAGWSEYEWRLKTERLALPPTGKPRWNGQPLDGKTILIIAEQGYGDAVQFVRYVRAVKNRGATVILGCRPALNRLLTECLGVDQVVSFGDPTPPPTMSMSRS